MGAVPCLTWIHAGVLANRPDEIRLSAKDVQAMKHMTEDVTAADDDKTVAPKKNKKKKKKKIKVEIPGITKGANDNAVAGGSKDVRCERKEAKAKVKKVKCKTRVKGESTEEEAQNDKVIKVKKEVEEEEEEGVETSTAKKKKKEKDKVIKVKKEVEEEEEMETSTAKKKKKEKDKVIKVKKEEEEMETSTAKKKKKENDKVTKVKKEVEDVEEGETSTAKKKKKENDKVTKVKKEVEDVEEEETSTAKKKKKENDKVTKVKNEVEEEETSTAKKKKKGKSEGSDDNEDRYNLSSYDDDQEQLVLGGELSELAMYLDNKSDPVLAEARAAGKRKSAAPSGSDDSDSSINSDLEDDVIEYNDSVLVLGTVNNEGDADIELHLYNPDLVQFYVHHHYPIAAFPLCLEYVQLLEESSATINLLAVASMTNDIELWDLDVVNSVSPLEWLTGHRDSILSMSWNRVARQAFASGSADGRVILWDICRRAVVSRLKGGSGRCQSVAWCPEKEHSLLTGSSDGHVSVYDCRTIPASARRWKVPQSAEVEQAIWVPFGDTNYCLAATSDGRICGIDLRAHKRPVFTTDGAHADSVTGICMSCSDPSCLVSVSADEEMKVWRVADGMSGLKLVDTERPPNLKSLYCVASCPDHGYVFAVGGSNGACYLWDIRNSERVRSEFTCS